jgi:hypothetical protein
LTPLLKGVDIRRESIKLTRGKIHIWVNDEDRRK